MGKEDEVKKIGSIDGTKTFISLTPIFFDSTKAL
jgi:hypothetical protein